MGRIAVVLGLLWTCMSHLHAAYVLEGTLHAPEEEIQFLAGNEDLELGSLDLVAKTVWIEVRELSTTDQPVSIEADHIAIGYMNGVVGYGPLFEGRGMIATDKCLQLGPITLRAQHGIFLLQHQEPIDEEAWVVHPSLLPLLR